MTVDPFDPSIDNERWAQQRSYIANLHRPSLNRRVEYSVGQCGLAITLRRVRLVLRQVTVRIGKPPRH